MNHNSLLKSLSRMLLFSAILLISLNLQAHEQIDHYRHELNNTTNDSIKVRRMLNIAWVYSDLGNDSAIYYAEDALMLATQSDTKHEIAYAHYTLGTFFYLKSEYAKAITYLEKSLSNYEELGSLKDQITVLKQLGNTYSQISAFTRSLDYYMHSAELNKVLNDSSLMAIIYNNIGVIYSELNVPKNALDYYRKALNLDKALLDTTNIILDYNNMAVVHLKKQDFDSAYQYLNDATILAKYHEINEFQQLVLVQSLGEYFLQVNKMDSAYQYLTKAYETNLTFNRTLETAYATYHLGVYHEKNKEYNKAITLYNKALELSKLFEYSNQNMEIYRRLSHIYKIKNNYQAAYQAILKSQKISDSLNFSGVRKTLADYELQKELELIRINTLLEQEDAQHAIETGRYRLKVMLIGFIIFITFSLLALVLYIRAYFIKKKSHNILEEQNKVIEQQKEDLRVLNTTKDKFFSLIAHDLKNPFNIMIGYSELLLHDEEYRQADKINEILTIINRTAVLSHSFLENLLDWARSQAGQLKVDASGFNLNGLIQDNIEFHQDTALLKGIKLKAELNEDIEVFCDRKMIDAVIRNLISNAIKFTNIGGHVLITHYRKAGNACISVSDDGIGIQKENIDKLFKIDNHFQIEGTANEKGTGLGLILCKEFIDKNKGRIDVESEEGNGSTFTVCLPLVKMT